MCVRACAYVCVCVHVRAYRLYDTNIVGTNGFEVYMNVIIAETDNGPSKIGTRCLRGIDAVTCNVEKKNTRRITVNPCRGARIISYRNFSPFSAFVKWLKQSKEPPCNPESLGPESSCLAGRLESGFVSSGTIQQIDKLKKKGGGGVKQASYPDRAVLLAL